MGRGTPRVPEKSYITDRINPRSPRGSPPTSGMTPPTTPNYYQLHRSRGALSSNGDVRNGQGRPEKHQPGAASEGSLSIWCPDNLMLSGAGGDPGGGESTRAGKEGERGRKCR